MSEQTKEQQLESAVVVLKARLFDVTDQAANIQAENKELSNALTEIAVAVGVTGETVALKDIVAAVKALVPVQGELDVEVE